MVAVLTDRLVSDDLRIHLIGMADDGAIELRADVARELLAEIDWMKRCLKDAYERLGEKMEA